MSNPAANSQGLATASAALGLLEQLETLAGDLGDFCSTLPQAHREELGILIARLSAINKLLDDEDSLPQIAQSMKLSGKFNSKVDRLRVGSEIVRMIEVQNLTVPETAQRVGLDIHTVRRFIKWYDECKPSEKAQYQRTSIFDTSTQYEQLVDMIYRQLERLELQDAENHVRYISELRQTIKAAQEWVDRISFAHRMEELTQSISDVLMLYVSEADRPQAIRAIQQAGLQKALAPDVHTVNVRPN